MQDRKTWRRKRTTPRASARIALVVHGPQRVVPAVTCDLSRTGARIRFRFEDLGVDRDLSLLELGKALMNLCGEVFLADMRPIRGEGHVSKAMHPVRIGSTKRTAGELDVGVRFQEPLSDAELGTLGLRMPVTDSAAERESA
jgi:hypothetical protein